MANSSDVLKAIKEGNIAQAEINATMVGKISAISNDLIDMREAQGKINSKVLGYLENDDKTNQMGAINRISVIEKKVSMMNNQRKIMIGVFLVFSTVGAFMMKAFGFFKT